MKEAAREALPVTRTSQPEPREGRPAGGGEARSTGRVTPAEERGARKGAAREKGLCLTTDCMSEIPEASQAKEPGREAGVVEA